MIAEAVGHYWYLGETYENTGLCMVHRLPYSHNKPFAAQKNHRKLCEQYLGSLLSKTSRAPFDATCVSPSKKYENKARLKDILRGKNWAESFSRFLLCVYIPERVWYYCRYHWKIWVRIEAQAFFSRSLGWKKIRFHKSQKNEKSKSTTVFILYRCCGMFSLMREHEKLFLCQFSWFMVSSHRSLCKFA